MAKDIVLVLGIGLFILALVGRVKTPHFEVGVRSTRKRILLGSAGLTLALVFFSPELARLYRGLFPPIATPVVLIEPIHSDSLSQDARYIGDKVHRNLAEILSNAGHIVIAPPLSVAPNSSSTNTFRSFGIRLTPERNNLSIHVALEAADKSLVSSTELNGTLSEFKEIYKVLPEAILFGLDIDERTLKPKKTAKPPTTSVEAFAHYLYARRKIGSGDGYSAQSALKRAIILDKKFALAYWTLGVFMISQGRPSEGHELVETADRLDPDHPKIPLTSPSQQSNPIPNLMYAVRASEAQELEPGFIFRKASSKDYGIEIRIWSVDPARYDIRLVEQHDSHGSKVGKFLEDANAILAVNGGFFKIDDLNRLSPAGLLVVNGIIRNASQNEQSGALVSEGGAIKILWAKDLGPLAAYNFVLQTGPILVENQGQLGIRRNDFDRLNRTAVCARDNVIIIVVLHGSNGNGLSLYEFAELLAAREKDGGLGCNVAANLDGGPSTQVAMDVRGVRETVDGLWKIHNAIVVKKQ